MTNSEYNYGNHLYVQKIGNENHDTGYSKFYNIWITYHILQSHFNKMFASLHTQLNT